jgi:hypothetical protein
MLRLSLEQRIAGSMSLLALRYLSQLRQQCTIFHPGLSKQNPIFASFADQEATLAHVGGWSYCLRDNKGLARL